MIERCGYCDLVHDVGDGSVTFHGQVIKLCPMVGIDQVVGVPRSKVADDDLDFFDKNCVIDA
jgi:hypothetical protein